MDKPQLILGTAEFGHPNYAPFPTKLQILRILNLAWEAGIITLDTADSYNCNDLLSNWAQPFSLMVKTRDIDKVKNNNYIYHYQMQEKPIEGILEASVYTEEQMAGLNTVIIPFNINDTYLAKIYVPEVFMRSVFGNGQLLKEYTVKDCLDFVKRHEPTGIIIGVRSERELEEILKVY